MLLVVEQLTRDVMRCELAQRRGSSKLQEVCKGFEQGVAKASLRTLIFVKTAASNVLDYRGAEWALLSSTRAMASTRMLDLQLATGI